MKKVLLAVAFLAGISFFGFISAADNSDIIDNLLKKDNADNPFTSFDKRIKDATDKLKDMKNNVSATFLGSDKFGKANAAFAQKTIDDAVKAKEDKYNSIKAELDAKIAKLDDSVKRLSDQIDKTKTSGNDTSVLDKALKQLQDDQAKYQDASKKLEGYYTPVGDSKDAKKKK